MFMHESEAKAFMKLKISQYSDWIKERQLGFNHQVKSKNLII